MRGARRYGVVAATAALALAGGSALTAPAAAQGQGSPNTSKKFTAAGTSGYEASGEYVESQLQAAGYETERQYFDFLYQEVLTESLVQNTPTSGEIDTIVMAYSPNTPQDGVTADLVVPGTDAQGCTVEDWGGVEPSGQIALVSRGTCPFADKAVVAGEVGAEAVIV